jgi:transposase InsO family protein
MEGLRREYALGVNEFLKWAGIAKSSYYRRKTHRAGVRPVQARIERRVKALCAKHQSLGHRPITALLNGRTHQASESSVFRVMQRYGLLQKKRPHRERTKSPPPTLDPKQIGMTIGLDFIHWQGYPICNVIEFQSRYCLAALAFEQETAESAQVAIRAALHEAKRLGLPAKGVDVKSDKGSPFIAEDFRKVLVENTCQQSLSGICIAGGTARVERFNRTTKEQGLAREDTEGLDEIQLALNRHRHYYNTQRPHQALGWVTPLSRAEINGGGRLK